jgi:hypothetical protein
LATGVKGPHVAAPDIIRVATKNQWRLGKAKSQLVGELLPGTWKTTDVFRSDGLEELNINSPASCRLEH